jgi:serine/threonine protein kinase
VKLTDFSTLIKDFTAGDIDARRLHEGIQSLLEARTDVGLGDLLAHTQAMLHEGELSAAHFRQISRLITELNIQQAVSTRQASLGRGHTGAPGDETLIMPHPPGDGADDETLIMPGGQPERRQPPEDTEPETGDRAPPSDSADETGRRRSQRRAKPPMAVKTGDVLKRRFELVELIGHGGMGVVFKARDLVRVRARDSNPYVAIKVLSEAFKKHSRAFIALQREASKAQSLAHPNIATVYDFDHDGDTIYMTMELLHGQPFDLLIGQLPPGGMPRKVALHYIEQLCNGLGYAHKQQLIHCDLKPANIYLCDNGTVKLLDFGITRAIKKERQESRDETLFDPASLKALTPAYASVEMFRGDTPDPRDDIYALACVCYELLTGVHPYKKVAAHKALELDLKPPPIKGLRRRQQKAFNKALALERDKRTASVDQFLEGIRPPQSHAKQLAATAGIILLAGAAVLFKPVQTQLHEEAQLQLIQSIKGGDRARLEQMLATIDEKDDKTRAYLTSILRKEIITYYQERINAAINASQRRYDFPKAAELLNEVQALYPDSASLSEAERQLRAKRRSLVSKLVERYEAVNRSGGDTRRILEILEEADPDHSLLERQGKE